MIIEWRTCTSSSAQIAHFGSTVNLEQRLAQHQNGEGSLYTRARLPVRLLYFEEFVRVDSAYYREKQVQGWSRSKRLALVHGKLDRLPALAKKTRRDVSRETERDRLTRSLYA